MAREEKAYARVIEKVKKMILSGELKPGEKLPPEREFAEKLEVSRNSVREAIRIMDMMGIVSSQQGSGNYVTCEFQKSITETMAMMFAMDQVNDKQISQVRYSMEVLAFTLALDRVREEDLAKMEECVEKLDKNGDSKNNDITVFSQKSCHTSRNCCILFIHLIFPPLPALHLLNTS